MAADKLVAEFREEAFKAFREQINEVVYGHVAIVVRDALAQPIQRYKPWGDKVGEPTSIMEIAREHIEGFLNKPAHRDAYSSTRRGEPQNLSELVEDHVKTVMRGELQAAVKEARATVTARVETALTKAVIADVAKKG
jgi:hypothetical protein